MRQNIYIIKKINKSEKKNKIKLYDDQILLLYYQIIILCTDKCI